MRNEQESPAPGPETLDAETPPAGSETGSTAGSAGGPGGVKKAAAASARGVRRAGSATGRAAGFTFTQARRATHAEGAGDTGLFRLIELHAFNAAGDAALALSLAGTLFFQVPTAQARGQVALFLGLTMLPFAVIAPLIGPFLDRFSHGRRWAIGATMALRAFLCWVLGDALSGGSTTALFPAALGCLIASKAYGVTRAAAVPRLLPPQLGLVKANSRISLAGVAGAAISAPLAAGAATFGAQWALRYAFLVFIGGTILAILLPPQVDNAVGEQQLALTSRGQGKRRRPPLPRNVVIALRSNSGLRLLSGFLTMFMAFLLRVHPFPGWEDRRTLAVGLVIGAAGAGSTLGIVLGSALRAVRPQILVVAMLLVDAAVAVVVALFYGLPTAVLLGLTAGLAQSLGKLSLDSLIQQDIPDQTRASAFARSETLLQMSWVVGGFIGIFMPLDPQIGLGVAAAILVCWSVWVVAKARARPPAP